MPVTVAPQLYVEDAMYRLRVKRQRELLGK